MNHVESAHPLAVSSFEPRKHSSIEPIACERVHLFSHDSNGVYIHRTRLSYLGQFCDSFCVRWLKVVRNFTVIGLKGQRIIRYWSTIIGCFCSMHGIFWSRIQYGLCRSIHGLFSQRMPWKISQSIDWLYMIMYTVTNQLQMSVLWMAFCENMRWRRMHVETCVSKPKHISCFGLETAFGIAISLSL